MTVALRIVEAIMIAGLVSGMLMAMGGRLITVFAPSIVIAVIMGTSSVPLVPILVSLMSMASVVACTAVVLWLTAGTIPRSRLEERCVEWLRQPLPSVAMRPARAMELAKSITLGEKWNKELMDYFMDEYDAEKMEDLLDQHCGLGRWVNASSPTPIENISREIERVCGEMSVFLAATQTNDMPRLRELCVEHKALVEERDHLEWRAEMMAKVQKNGV